MADAYAGGCYWIVWFASIGHVVACSGDL